MRNCALWITPWVDRDTEVIMDTSAMTDQEWRAVVHHDRNVPPKDTILVLIHPERSMDLQLRVWEMPPLSMVDCMEVNGRRIAAYLVDKHCYHDPELRRRLRW